MQKKDNNYNKLSKQTEKKTYQFQVFLVIMKNINFPICRGKNNCMHEIKAKQMKVSNAN